MLWLREEPQRESPVAGVANLRLGHLVAWTLGASLWDIFQARLAELLNAIPFYTNRRWIGSYLFQGFILKGKEPKDGKACDC